MQWLHAWIWTIGSENLRVCEPLDTGACRRGGSGSSRERYLLLKKDEVDMAGTRLRTAGRLVVCLELTVTFLLALCNFSALKITRIGSSRTRRWLLWICHVCQQLQQLWFNGNCISLRFMMMLFCWYVTWKEDSINVVTWHLMRLVP
jgi:hypothetical protein